MGLPIGWNTGSGRNGQQQRSRRRQWGNPFSLSLFLLLPIILAAYDGGLTAIVNAWSISSSPRLIATPTTTAIMRYNNKQPAFIISNNNNNNNKPKTRRSRTTTALADLSVSVEESTNQQQRREKPDASNTTNDQTKTKSRIIPIHLLAGFLGAGKTSVLQHMLGNADGLRLGIIVNDVASINIDAKLLLSQQQPDNSSSSSSSSSRLGNDAADIQSTKFAMVELQNGCACCSLADELWTSVDQLLTTTTKPRLQQQQQDDGDDDENISALPAFDAIVVELSGVADPVAIQNNWKQLVASSQATGVTERTELGNVITVVDASTFGTDYMTWDVVGDRPNYVDSDSMEEAAMVAGCTVNRKIVELLAEQIEAANVLVLNKQDLATPEQNKVAQSMIRALLPADSSNVPILGSTLGQVPLSQLLKDYTTSIHNTVVVEQTDANEAVPAACDKPDCTDHEHEHSHSHWVEQHLDDNLSIDASAPTLTDCEDTTCSDPTHDHAHNNHDHRYDTSNDGSSSSSSNAKTSTENLGISNFVYKASSPFHAQRLMALLYQWPVPVKDELDLSLLHDAIDNGYKIRNDSDKNDGMTSPFVGVLRSKGFCWMAPVAWDIDQKYGFDGDDSWRHNTAMYWSHAGRHLGLTEAGRWWHSVLDATVDGNNNNKGDDVDPMRRFFVNNPAEYERVLREDFVTTEFGDRRQELVFIGVTLHQDAIRQALDQCLLTDAEMKGYRAQLRRVLESSSTV